MRVIARSTLARFWIEHPSTRASLLHWYGVTHRTTWSSMTEVQAAFPKAKVLNGERVRFEVSGGNYRLIAAFNFRISAAYVKFLGTHAEYDNVDPFTVSLY